MKNIKLIIILSLIGLSLIITNALLCNNVSENIIFGFILGIILQSFYQIYKK